MSMSTILPCHCLNVFIPLIDIGIENGPTEFRPGSQLLTQNFKSSFLAAFAKKSLRPIEAPLLHRGSILMVQFLLL